MLIVASLVLLVIAMWATAPRRRQGRRRRWFATPPPSAWAPLLEREVPLYQRLPAGLRTQLHGHLQVFLREKKFVGCNGLAPDERMRVIIAAQACLLLLNRHGDYFPGFTSVLIYPESFVVPVVRRDGALETRDHEVRSGESWQRGPVVLSWQDIQQGLLARGGGRNVVLHEFAHKLDEENGAVDGVPALRDATTQAAWIEQLGREYDLLRLRARNVEDDVIDRYGATSPAEFFAVATEVFFERPQALAARHPRLYEVLRDYFQVDPGLWRENVSRD